MTRQTRILTVLGIALVAAAAASYGVYQAISHLPVKQVEVPSSHAVVAKRAMPMGTLLGPDDVRLVAWPERSTVDGAFTSIDPVLRRGLVTGVAANELILESKLAPAAAGGGLPPVIAPGMRAISVKVNEVVGVAGFVVPGTRVDVVTVMRVKDENISKTVVKNAQVLTSGTRYDQEQARKDAKPMPESTVVTLLVTPDDAQRIALAQTEGHLQLALRNPLDVETPELAAIGTGGLVGALPAATGTGGRLVPAASKPHSSKPRTIAPPLVAPVVAPPPPPPEKKAYTVDVIRAAKRTEEVVR